MAKLKILKTGETDIESTDIWRFSVHSDYPTQKIYSSGQTTLTILEGETSGEKTISHSLGYAPIVMAMFEESAGKFVKVLGQTKAVKEDQSMQFFAVNEVTNTVTARAGYGPGAESVDSYVDVDDVIRFTSAPGNLGVLPNPLQANTNYYVISTSSSTTFKISTSKGGSEVNITDGGGAYADIFENITNPYLIDINRLYSISSTDNSIVFESSPILTTPLAGKDTDILIYYMILYEQI